MRTLEEIKKRIEEHVADKSPLGNRMMIAACGGVHPLMYFHPDYIKEGYQPDPLTEEAVIDAMRKYIDFAFEKAHNQRGLSANRSIWKFTQWLWLIEDEALLDFAENSDNYPMYGLPILRAIAEKYGFKEAEP